MTQPAIESFKLVLLKITSIKFGVWIVYIIDYILYTIYINVSSVLFVKPSWRRRLLNFWSHMKLAYTSISSVRSFHCTSNQMRKLSDFAWSLFQIVSSPAGVVVLVVLSFWRVELQRGSCSECCNTEQSHSQHSHSPHMVSKDGGQHTTTPCRPPLHW